MDYRKMSGEESLDLLYTQKDLLPGAAIDEFVRRGDLPDRQGGWQDCRMKETVENK